MTINDATLVVERVDRVSRRPWIFVTGRLDGGPLKIGERVLIHHGDGVREPALIRSIEMHSAPGKTTIAIDESLASLVTAGTVISQAG